jgi:FPC/CPF motif-containing protein YcgG
MSVKTIERMPPKAQPDLEKIKQQFKEFIITRDHPCIMAQTVFTMEEAEFVIGEKMGGKTTTEQLYAGITQYLDTYDFDSNEFRSLIAVFPNDRFASEEEFENALWYQLQQLHDIDSKPWDAGVSPNPESSEFSFSISGKAFYIVGMHPESSRIARSAPYPTMVFNLHWQFEKLREMGSYTTVRDKIRERDAELQGTINPVLNDFGKDSEARQYSGRNVPAHWKCPFLNKHN